MPVAVTCQCGSKLEIDEKFLGKEIPCPDCQRALPTTAPPTPPPLDLPEYHRTSGLAILSLGLAIVGAFTILGSLLAVAAGILALKQIKQMPHKYEGVGIARAGIIVGGVMTVITLLALFSPSILVDSYFREIVYGPRLHYPAAIAINDRGDLVSLKRPSSDWGVYTPPTRTNTNIDPDDVILVNTREDAFIACQSAKLEWNDDNAEAHRKKALERLQKSELVNLIGHLRGQPLPGDRLPFDVEKDKKEVKDAKDAKKVEEKNQEIIFDAYVGGQERRFLVRFLPKDRTKLTVLVAVSRKSNFSRLEKEFRETFDNVKVK